jgi:hypothetical protein
MLENLNQRINNYVICVAVFYALLLLFFLGADLFKIDLTYKVNFSLNLLAQACFAYLLSYLTYTLYLNKEKRVVSYAFVAYIAMMLISIIYSAFVKFTAITPVFVILGFIAYVVNIFLFIQVFRIKRNAFKAYYVSMVLIFFILFIIKVLAPVVIGLNTSNTMELPLLLGQVNKVSAIINLLVPLSIILILTHIQKQISESKMVNQPVV